MPEQPRTLAEAKKQHDEFMALLAAGAHLDTEKFPLPASQVTPVYEDGTPVPPTVAPAGAAESRVETLQHLCWDSFSARYHHAEPAELERFPKLKAAWDEWKTAWCAGIEAYLSTTK